MEISSGILNEKKKKEFTFSRNFIQPPLKTAKEIKVYIYIR